MYRSPLGLQTARRVRQTRGIPMRSRKHPVSNEDRRHVWPRRVWLPGALLVAIQARMQELQSGNLSRYLVELIAFDLRERHLHSITGPLARESLRVQQAVDEAIARHYEAGKKSNRAQIEKTVREGFQVAGTAPDAGGLLTKERHLVYLRKLHRDAINTRLRELRFAHLSEYVVSLIRYDLLLGGPHKYFYGDDCPPEMCLALDRETLEIFHKNEPRKCMIDYVVEEAAGRAMSVEERHAELRKTSAKLTDQAVEMQKKARRNSGG